MDTVGAEEVGRRGIKVPEIPSYEEWTTSQNKPKAEPKQEGLPISIAPEEKPAGALPLQRSDESGRILLDDNRSELKKAIDHWFRVDKGVGPVVDRLNDERLGKIMVNAFDSSLNAKTVKAFFAKNPSVPVQQAVFDYLRGQGPIDAVPEVIRKNAEEMRKDIDNLSSLVSKHGIAPENETLRSVIEGNMGKYLGRYYRLFEQKKHGGGEYVPKPEDVKAFKEWARKERPNTFGKMSEEEMDGFIKNLLDKGTARIGMGQKKINVPQNHFIKRKNVPDAVRRLYGEITDPVWLYLKTMADQAVVAFNGEFLSNISKLPGVFQDKPISESYKKLPDGKAWGPVAGKYVTKDMHDFLVDNLGTPGRGWFAGALQDYVVNPFKWTKTVGSLPSHPRNAMGNIAFALLADVSPTNPLNAKYYADALSILTNKNKGRANDWRELLRNRVVGGQYWGSEVPKLLNELILDPQTYASKVADVIKWPIEKLGNLYNNEDLVFRIAAYRKYRAQGMSEKEASTKVDRYFTNYDKLPRAVKGMRDWGALGPFLSFKASVVRIMKNAGVDAFDSLKKGNPLPAVRLAAVLAFPAMLAKLSKELFDIDDDDVKKLESYMQPYRRNGSMIYFRDSKGKLQAFDLSYIWPSGEFERAGRALLKGDMESFNNAMDFFTHPALDAWSILFQNVDPFTKSPVSSDLDPLGRQMYERVKKLASSIYIPASLPVPDIEAAKKGKLEPGLLTGYQIKTLIDAYNGVTDRYGRKRELPDELRSFFTGIRTWQIYPEVVVEQYLRRRVADAMGEKQDFKSWMKRNMSARQEAKEERVRLYETRMKKLREEMDDAKKFLKERVKKLEGR